MEETAAKPMPEKMVAHQFKKGGTPWNKGKKMPKKTPANDASSDKEKRNDIVDDNTVTIHIVKEKKPLPPKDFSGKLEDLKERTAIRFIRSVAARKPMVVKIDGLKYYSEAVFNKECEESMAKEEQLKSCTELMAKGVEVVAEARMIAERLYKSRKMWKAIAFGMMIGWVTALAINAFCK